MMSSCEKYYQQNKNINKRPMGHVAHLNDFYLVANSIFILNFKPLPGALVFVRSLWLASTI